MGCSASETGGVLTQDPETVTGYTLTGCVRSMFSNRLSFTFDLRGCKVFDLKKGVRITNNKRFVVFL